MDKPKTQHYIYLTLSVLFFFIGFAMSHIPEHMFTGEASIVSVMFLSAPAFWAVIKMYSQKGFVIIVALGAWALLIETIGIHTGFPYSSFEYVLDFGYRLFGTTPWTVSIAWSPLVIGSFLAAKSTTKNTWAQLGLYLGTLIGLDLVLDPGAVARGLWEYTEGGIWFGVPIQNFLGWLFSGLVAYLILTFILRKTPQSNAQHGWIGIVPLAASVSMWTGVTLGYGLYIPALCGLVLGVIVSRILFSPQKVT